MNTIHENIQETLYNKFSRIPNFYMIPKIHKRNNPVRPTVNSIGSITEKISTYLDEHKGHLFLEFLVTSKTQLISLV